MPESTKTLLDQMTIDIASLSDGTDLVDTIRSAARDSDPEWGTSWVLVSGEGTMPSAQRNQLLVGVRGDVGAVTWHEPGKRAMVPRDGRNREHVDYSLADLHHTPMPPRSELPLTDVLSAVAEFARTGERPSVVNWS